jgi:DNA-binding transcriptional regulator YdaS (Cro superfamily)
MDDPLSKAIHLFRSRSGLARALGIKPQAVQQWKRIPNSRALEIETLTEGKVTAREILEQQCEEARA